MDLSEIKIGEYIKLLPQHDTLVKCNLILRHTGTGWRVVRNDNPQGVSYWSVGTVYPLRTANLAVFEKYEYKSESFIKLYEKLQSV